MTVRPDPDAERVRRAARIVGTWVAVSSGVIVLGGVVILLLVVLTSSRRDGERHDGGWFAGGGDDFVIDIDVIVPVVIVLGIVGVVLLFIVASAAARRASAPLGDALRRQREFVADASHELRTPLTALTSRIQIVQRRLERGEDATEVIGDLRRDADRMRDILSDMLIAAEGESFAGESADVSDAVREAVDAVHSLAADAEVRIDVDVDAADAAVQVPTVSLIRMLVALLDNAVAYSPPGGVVAISVRSTATRSEIRVADRGRGISGIDPDDVFERFARSPGSGGGRGRGFGLGLSLVRDVARRAGGSVVVESTSAEGTVFLLTLPTATRQR